MPRIPALTRLRYEDQEFKTSLGYIVGLRKKEEEKEEKEEEEEKLLFDSKRRGM